MTDKKQNKSIVVCFAAMVLVLVVTGALFLALPHSASGVASAYTVNLPDDGVVGANLLQNSDFSINTKCEDFYNAQGWTYDDWYLWNGLGTVSYNFNSGGLLLNANKSASQNLILSQSFNYSIYKGKKLTLTVSAGSEIFSTSVLIPSTITDNLGAFYLRDSSDVAYAYVRFGFYPNGTPLNGSNGVSYQIDIGVFPAKTLVVNWIKCEQGDSFTGYVPNYQDTIKKLQTEYENLYLDYKQLQQNYVGANSALDSLEGEYNKLLASNALLEASYNNVVSELNIARDRLRDLEHFLVDLNMRVSPVLSPSISYNNDNYWYSSAYSSTDGTTSVYFDKASMTNNYRFGFATPFDFHNLLSSQSFDIAFPITVSFDFLRLSSNHNIYDYPWTGYLYFVFFDSNYNIIPLQKANYHLLTKTTEYYLTEVPYYWGILSLITDDSVDAMTFKGTISGYTKNSFSEVYSLGFQEGVESVDIQESFTDGYNEGYRVGQDIGYLNGMSDQGDYTFFGLISSTIDAPLSVFRKMFNFEILGTNMSAFMLSLFTVCIILAVVKLLLGR